MTQIQLSRIHFPVEVLGYGRRAGIWFQGCSIGCPGCVSTDTWSPTDGISSTVGDVIDRLGELVGGRSVDGITISGGEPLQQPEALSQLIDGLMESLAMAQATPIDVLMFTGYPLSHARRRHAGILDRVDAVVSGPFMESRSPSGALVASDNQELTVLSELGEQRYSLDAEGGDVNMNSAASVQRIQFSVDDGTVWMVGLPARGDMERLEGRLREKGIRLEDVSWRS